MGTDICIFFEYFDPAKERWFALTIKGYRVKVLTDEELEDIAGDSPFPRESWEEQGLEHDTNRGYPLFGLLAGIRCDDVKPLAEPRGFPEDSAYFKNEKMREDIENNYAHTYFSLTELMFADTAFNREEHEYKRMANIIQPLIMFCREQRKATDDFRAIISFN